MSAEHSPLPWDAKGPGGHVFSGDKLVAGCMGHQDNFTPNLHDINIANAEFIVRAVNCHDELLAALKRIATIRDAGESPEDAALTCIDIALAAIAKAEGR